MRTKVCGSQAADIQPNTSELAPRKFIRYSTEREGRTDQEFGLFSIAQTDVNQALLYSSRDANQQQSSDRVNEAWSDVFQDQGTWENPTTGDRHKIPDTFTNLGTPTQDGVALQAVPLGDL